MSWATKFLPGLAAMARYDRSWFRFDLVAGLSVAAVAVPIAIAYSQLAGVPPVHGLYASILPLVAYAFLGTSRQLIVAPDAATCAVVATIVAPLAAGDPSRTIPLTMVLTMLTGLFCIAAGIARLGFLTNFLARPILTGYLNGVALSIISGQLGKLFGFSLDPNGFFRLLAQFVSKLGQTHGLTVAVGIGMFALLRLLKHLVPKIPAPLVAVVVGIGASALFGLGGRGVALLGLIPAGLPALFIPAIGAGDWGPLALGAIGLALISFNSGMVTARGFAVKNRYGIDSNQEFIALGVADLGAGLLQGFAVSGADSRTAVNDSVGGKSQATSLVAAGLLVVVLLFLTGPLALLPITVIAAVLINSALGLFDLSSLVRLRRLSSQEFRLSLVATLGVITVGVLPGVVVAVVLAIAQLLAKASRPHDAVLGCMPGSDEFHDIENRPEVQPVQGFVLYRFDSSLVFFNADHFQARVRALVKAASPRPRHLVLDAETMPFMDTTGAATLQAVMDELAEQGVTVAVANAKGPVRTMLERAGLARATGEVSVFPSLAAAVAKLSQNEQTPEHNPGRQGGRDAVRF
jgi:high affinity sulfate transporter 1